MNKKMEQKMTKIKEIVDRIERFEGFCDSEDVKEVMKEYAEWYANKCLNLVDKLPIEVPIGSFQLPEHE